jgi:hypothetical protein
MIHNINSAKLCIEYVLEVEGDDFRLNPSANHVYYHAMVALFGENCAKDDLIEALEEMPMEDL